MDALIYMKGYPRPAEARFEDAEWKRLCKDLGNFKKKGKPTSGTYECVSWNGMGDPYPATITLEFADIERVIRSAG